MDVLYLSPSITALPRKQATATAGNHGKGMQSYGNFPHAQPMFSTRNVPSFPPAPLASACGATVSLQHSFRRWARAETRAHFFFPSICYHAARYCTATQPLGLKLHQGKKGGGNTDNIANGSGGVCRRPFTAWNNPNE